MGGGGAAIDTRGVGNGGSLAEVEGGAKAECGSSPPGAQGVLCTLALGVRAHLFLSVRELDYKL